MNVVQKGIVAASILVRLVILILLLGWIVSWPLLIAAAGATLEHPEHGMRVALTFTAQSLLSLAAMMGAAFLHDRRWFWAVAGSLAFWFPATLYSAHIVDGFVR
ncbi:MAG: hypothetical protein ABI898_08620 [Sphingomonadales bacterium]